MIIIASSITADISFPTLDKAIFMLFILITIAARAVMVPTRAAGGSLEIVSRAVQTIAIITTATVTITVLPTRILYRG